MTRPRKTGLSVRRRSIRGLLLLTVASTSWAVTAVLAAPPANTATASSLSALGFAGNDAIYNYDFYTNTVSASNVDWTASMFFYNNAEIDKVKDVMFDFGGFENNGDIQDGRLKDDASYVWDTDRGMKNPPGWACNHNPQPQNIHMRMYADGDDRMYNTQDGYYIFGTTHWDVLENCPGEYFGESEDAEYWFKQVFYRMGYQTYPNNSFWYNYEPFRAEGNHIWNSNGYATLVPIP